MTITKATASKNKFSVKKNNLNKTDDNSKSKTKNFDLGGIKDYKISVSLAFTIIIFICGILWYIAGSVVFDQKSEILRAEIKDDYNNDTKDINSQIKDIQINLNNLNNKVDNIKIRNPSLK